ncbi:MULTISPECIES: hypothetical protein [Kitasatospora]|uniref:hypothetical protein n=1 Tax=Kitasatospora TaxID=2063 RepID=UPI000CC62264|nr:hypothetical protein [Kitasatospora sp. GP30]MDH6144530.1 ABC-type dipeptide/oligopeptide/nickel transport system permease subunit [Kitasatospora sp. GP30]
MRSAVPDALIAIVLAVVFTLALASLVLGVVATLRMARAADEEQWASRQRPGR